MIGHTGSGKSTLIQHLNGLIKPTSGTIYFDDEDIYSEGYPLRELRGKVGICFQYTEHQLFETTILDDVCFGSSPAVGSSSIKILGLFNIACAIPALRFIPPDNFFIFL